MVTGQLSRNNSPARVCPLKPVRFGYHLFSGVRTPARCARIGLCLRLRLTCIMWIRLFRSIAYRQSLRFFWLLNFLLNFFFIFCHFSLLLLNDDYWRLLRVHLLQTSLPLIMRRAVGRSSMASGLPSSPCGSLCPGPTGAPFL